MSQALKSWHSSTLPNPKTSVSFISDMNQLSNCNYRLFWAHSFLGSISEPLISRSDQSIVGEKPSWEERGGCVLSSQLLFQAAPLASKHFLNVRPLHLLMKQVLVCVTNANDLRKQSSSKRLRGSSYHLHGNCVLLLPFYFKNVGKLPDLDKYHHLTVNWVSWPGLCTHSLQRLKE